MNYFIDTANIYEINGAASICLIDGVFTNPCLLAHEATILFEVIKKIFNHPVKDGGLEKLLSDWKTLNKG